MKENSNPVIVEVPESPSGSLNRLDLTVDPFSHRIGDPVSKKRDDMSKILLNNKRINDEILTPSKYQGSG